MLTATVDAFERLFVQQHAEAVVTGYFTHQCHDEHVMVYSQVTFFEDGSQFELVGGYLIVTRFNGDTELQCFDFQFLHKGCHAGRDGTEIVVFQLLVLGTVVSHQRTACHQQVGTGGIQTFVDQEIFLFPTQIGNYLLYFRIEVTAYVYGSFVYGTQGFQQRSFVIQ